MKIKNLIVAICLLFALPACSQEPMSNEQLGSVYYAYPGPTQKQTIAPEGYEPFYISHYGRHGSRWMTNDIRYLQVTGILDSLHQVNGLTELGEDVRLRMQLVWEDAKGRSGSITPLGERQMREIAERMYQNYPAVFKGEATIDARSSTSLRAAISMSYFTERLKEINPNLQVSRSAHHGYMDYIAHTDAEGEAFSAEDAPWRKKYFYDFEARMVRPERLMKSLFKNPKEVKIDQTDLMRSFYWIAADMQNVELELSFYDIFTRQELENIWKTVNARMYVCNANAPLAKGLMVGQARPLLRNFIESAEAVIQEEETIASHLRFGHDTHLIRLLTLMQIEGCCHAESNIEHFHKAWQDWRVAPMGGNLQWIFYRNAKGNVIVKFLLNENEVKLPIQAISGPYYNWNDVKEFLSSKL